MERTSKLVNEIVEITDTSKTEYDEEALLLKKSRLQQQLDEVNSQLALFK